MNASNRLIDETDEEILRQLEARCYKPRSHGETEALCWKAAQVMRRLMNAAK